MADGGNASLIKAAPAVYINQPHILGAAGEYVARLSDRVLISGGPRALGAVKDNLTASLSKSGLSWSARAFVGESSEKNVEMLAKEIRECGANAVIGVGGGKSLDTAKIAADLCRIPVISVPSIAATCAATTPMGIIYSDEGVYLREHYMATNPALALVDTAIMVASPIEYMYSGILDALAKWYEGMASFEESKNADLFDDLAITIAESLYTKMMKNADDALAAMKEKRIRESLIEVIHLNVYVAGMIQSLGVKAVRNGIAHAVHNGLSVLPESHGLRHGLKVGYGIAVQMGVQNRPRVEVEELLSFFKRIGFKPSFSGLGLPFNDISVAAVAEKTVVDPLMTREPFSHITKAMLIEAMNRLEMSPR